jgi:hypothetical protein
MSTATVLQIEKDPRFPIGKFRRSEADLTHHAAAIATLAALPENLRSAVSGLSGKQLDTPYRDGGWSHMNAYVRVRLALTEDWPVVKAYDEKLWAELADATTAPIDFSLELLDALHARWVILLRSLNESQWQSGYTHSENGRQSLAEAVALYDWHCRHHVAHIVELRKRMNW